MDLDQKWAHDMSLTQMSPDTLLRLESMCILCVLAAVWPHTFTIRYCYLLWYMICWTELSGSTFTKAIDLLVLYISLVNDKVQCLMNGVVETSYPILSQDLLLNWTLFLLVWLECCHMNRATVGYCIKLIDHKWSWKSLLKPFHMAFEVLSSFLHAKQAVTFVVCICLISSRLLINEIHMHLVTETKPLKCFQIPYSMVTHFWCVNESSNEMHHFNWL